MTKYYIIILCFFVLMLTLCIFVAHSTKKTRETELTESYEYNLQLLHDEFDELTIVGLNLHFNYNDPDVDQMLVLYNKFFKLRESPYYSGSDLYDNLASIVIDGFRIKTRTKYMYNNTDILISQKTDTKVGSISLSELELLTDNERASGIIEREELIYKGDHPLAKQYGWSGYQITRILNREIWIGMPVTGLYYQRGLPDAVNKSNYGYGWQYQYCWRNYNSYAYDNNGDGYVDAFN